MYAILAECPACEGDEDFQVFIPAYIYRADRSIADPPLKRWECTTCRTTLRESALESVVELVPKQ